MCVAARGPRRVSNLLSNLHGATSTADQATQSGQTSSNEEQARRFRRRGRSAAAIGGRCARAARLIAAIRDGVGVLRRARSDLDRATGCSERLNVGVGEVRATQASETCGGKRERGGLADGETV